MLLGQRIELGAPLLRRVRYGVDLTRLPQHQCGGQPDGPRRAVPAHEVDGIGGLPTVLPQIAQQIDPDPLHHAAAVDDGVEHGQPRREGVGVTGPEAGDGERAVVQQVPQPLLLVSAAARPGRRAHPTLFLALARRAAFGRFPCHVTEHRRRF